MAGNEVCDDGNEKDFDGCSSVCTLEPGFECSHVFTTKCKSICGDGLKRGKEECDDGNPYSKDGCSSLCKVEKGY